MLGDLRFNTVIISLITAPVDEVITETFRVISANPFISSSNNPSF